MGSPGRQSALMGYCSVGARCLGWVAPSAHPGAHFNSRRRKCTLCALPRGPVVRPCFHCGQARRCGGIAQSEQRCLGWVAPSAHPGAHFSRRRRKCTLCALPRGPVVRPCFHCGQARRCGGIAQSEQRCLGWVAPSAHPGAHFSRRRRKCTLCALPRGPVVPPYFHCERARRYVAPTRVAAFAQLLRASTAYGAVAVISPCFLGQF